jgi:putative Holliday junction resolvase
MLAVDVGAKRLGLALSDASGRLARPWQTVPAGPTPAASAEAVAGLIRQHSDELTGETAGLGRIIVGFPRRLNGDETDQSKICREFAAAIGALTGLEVRLQDERLSSREAEALLARDERDWRERKKKIDAVAAAIILQDYLDHG